MRSRELFEEHRRVFLKRRLPTLKLQPGDAGVVVHVYEQGDAYEVEFVSGDGRVCVETVQAADLLAMPCGDCRVRD